MLNKILAMEGSPLFTQNVQFLEDRVKHWRSRYVNERAPCDPDDDPTCDSTPLDLPSDLPSPPLYTFPKLAFDPAVDGSKATWGVDDELGVMANVQAYFEVAHRVSFLFVKFQEFLDDLSLTQRIIDNVPLIIEHELNQKFATRIRNKLINTIFKD